MADASFRLTDEPWLPVLRVDGRADELSLREIFAQAHDIATLTLDLPTQHFAVVRFLLAILRRSIGAVREPGATWRELWGAPTLPIGDVSAYLDRYADRFDVFHPESPFLQVADLRIAKGDDVGLERLIPDAAGGLFSMRRGAGVEAVTPAEAARWLIHVHGFSVAGIYPAAVGDPLAKGGKRYPEGVGALGSLGGILVEGSTLRETLLLNLVLGSRVDSPLDEEDDSAVWEREPLGVEPEPRLDPHPLGTVDNITWPSRRVRLVREDRRVTGAVICYGDRYPLVNLHRVEHMTAWRRRAGKTGEIVMSPLRHQAGRALWRGLAPLLGQSSGTADTTAPGTLLWLAQLRDARILSPAQPIRLRAVGVEYGTQDSVITQVIDDVLPMRLVLLGEADRGLADLVVQLVAQTEDGARALAQLGGDLAVAAGGDPGPARDAAARLAYERLDRPFREWLGSLAPGMSVDEAGGVWVDRARRILGGAADELVRDAGTPAWVGRKRAGTETHITSSRAHQWFRIALARALPRPHEQATLDPAKETA